MLALLKARCIIRDEESVYFDSAPNANETRNPIHEHAKTLDPDLEHHSSGVGKSQSNNSVNLQDVGGKRKRKRSAARSKQRSLTMSETSVSTNLFAERNRIGGSLCQPCSEPGRSDEVGSLDTTHNLLEFSDSPFSDAELRDTESNDAEQNDAEQNDAKTFSSRPGVELIESGNVDSRLMEVSKLDSGPGSVSDSSEDEEID